MICDVVVRESFSEVERNRRVIAGIPPNLHGSWILIALGNASIAVPGAADPQ